MAVIHHCAIMLAGQRHVFDVLFSAVWSTERADHSCCFVEMRLLDECFDHFIAPEDVRLNERFADAVFTAKLLRVVVPPFERGFL